MTEEKNKLLMIIPHFEFRDEEYEKTRKIIEEAGVKVVVASTSTHEAHGRFGLRVKPDISINEIHVREYEAIIFIGGKGIQEYVNDGVIIRIIQEAFNSHILLAATSKAPILLANAGVLANKKVTSSHYEKHNVEAAGAFYTGRLVEQDGEIVTAIGAEAADDFGKAILRALEWRSSKKDTLFKSSKL